MASNALGNSGGRMYSFGVAPVLVDCSFNVTPTNGLGITNLKGQGVSNVFMHTSTTPVKGSNGYLNPNPAAGYALIQLSSNYNRFLGEFSAVASATTGSALGITASGAALTIGNAYQIASVGHAVAGQATIAPAADVSGSLASTYFSLYDAYGNIFVIWFSVSGVGAPPLLGNAAAPGVAGLHYVQQTIASGATAATIGAALVLTIQNLASGISGVSSFTASGTTTVTVISTSTVSQLAGIPQDGAIATGFTFALTVNDNNLADWNGVGLPKGLVPTIGQSFIATATGFGSSTGTVNAVGVSGITSMEIVGNPTLSLAPQAQGGSPNVGGWVLVQLLGATNSSTTTLIPVAPAAGTNIRMCFMVDSKQSPSNGIG